LLYYLIMNLNGFEEPLRVGTEARMEADKLQLETAEMLSHQTDNEKQVWGRRSYYIVPKTEWDRQDCPLIPVDLS
jgi:hypothetical protein